MNDSFKDSNHLMEIFGWIPRLLYLNILWFIGCLSGIIVAGIGPATVSLFDTLKELLWKKNKVDIKEHFFKVYKREWKTINKWIVLLYGIGLFLWIDYRLVLFFNYNKLIMGVVYPLLIVLTAIIILSIMYFFVFYTNFNLPILKKMENSLLLALSNPLHSFLILFSLILYYNLIIRWLLILIFFFASLPALIITLILKKIYFKIIQATHKVD